MVYAGEVVIFGGLVGGSYAVGEGVSRFSVMKGRFCSSTIENASSRSEDTMIAKIMYLLEANTIE